MRQNRYAGRCEACGTVVPPFKGQITKQGRRWATWCAEHGERSDGIVCVRVGGREGGTDLYRNARGRCIDAPCCGCCTF